MSRADGRINELLKEKKELLDRAAETLLKVSFCPMRVLEDYVCCKEINKCDAEDEKKCWRGYLLGKATTNS